MLLVTGGAGYIGSVAAELLLDSGEDVVVVDNLSRGHRVAVPARATFIHGDILDRGLLDRLFRDYSIDTVLHFAAFAEVGESWREPAQYFHNNVVGSHGLLQTMVECGVPRFVFSSSAAVYGTPDKVPITEETPTRPLNPYGLSKRMVEDMLPWYAEAYGLQYISLRYFNAGGATAAHGEDHEPESHLIPRTLLAALGKAESITVYGADYPTADGTCIRDYVHVEDLADAHIRAVKYLREGGHSDVFNLGNAAGSSVLEVIEMVRRVTGKDIPLIHAERRPGDPARLVASSEKAERVLGWKARKPELEVIVRDAWRWRQAHPTGYAR